MSTPSKLSVLFICTGNSARSQMAEVLLRNQAGDYFDVYSAGTAPKSIHPLTLEALSRFGISEDDLHAKPLSDFGDKHFDYVITLCDKAANECTPFTHADKQIAWDFPDPAQRKGLMPFETTLTEISNRISMFVSVVTRQINNDILNPTDFFKCLTDELRLKCLMLIQFEGELCVCELMSAFDESQPKISRNLALLRKSNVLLDRRQGQWVFYRINPDLPMWAKAVLATATESNVSFIHQHIERLESMGDRPARIKNCCH